MQDYYNKINKIEDGIMTIKVGNHNSSNIAVIPNKGCRTKKQFEAARNVIQEEMNIGNFQHLCNNPFVVDKVGESYKCTFRLLWYSDDCLCAVMITPTGILKDKFKSENKS